MSVWWDKDKARRLDANRRINRRVQALYEAEWRRTEDHQVLQAAALIARSRHTPALVHDHPLDEGQGLPDPGYDPGWPESSEAP